ncbi:MAG TPA: phosphoenolpyruvate--protein phosphotransferase [Anaeromyxobacteraceae bacterium]|nr:phosphoenolpyruvate--protein phosphotransferase [Anaeromyxobacteraceae bacterium]
MDHGDPAVGARERAVSRVLKGEGVSSGVARGVAFVLACGDRSAAPRRDIDAADVARERARLDAALATARAELEGLRQDVSARIGPAPAEILGAQALVLEDPHLRERVLRLVEEKRVNVEGAISDVIEGYTRALDGVADAYLRERAADVRDVGRRLLSALAERRAARGPDLPEGAIVVSDELLPSVTARLQLGSVRAFVTERGHRFSHSSILARSQGTPAVARVADAPSRIRTGDRLIVDGEAGVVFVDPDAAVEREYDRLEAELRSYREALRENLDQPSATLDGVAVPLLANINKVADAGPALLYGAEGVGLYRTEFQFTIRDRFPSEDEQRELLARVAERFHPREVVFRLVDLGGDKVLPYFPLPPARNPSLAERGIRLLLRHPDLLKAQLRAFLRVAADHPVSVLLPVVGGLDEVREARDVVRQVERELSAAGVRFGAGVRLGAMVEVPSAALVARALAREVDFLSLGTNDLVQYVLAADREDQGVASYYQPLHPAVLRLIQLVVEGAQGAGRELTICGEMAGDPRLTALLLGLGLRRLSVAPGEMLEVKDAVRRTRLADASDLAHEALQLGSAAEIEALLEARRAALSGGVDPRRTRHGLRADGPARGGEV